MRYEYEDLFKQSSIPKELVIEFDNGEIFDNEKIYSESMEINESICSSEELTFGSIESNSFKVTLSDTLQSHKNMWFNAYLILNNNNATKYQLGRYFVVEDKALGDHSKRDITAYDKLYIIVSSDVSEWYNRLTFPMTLKSFRTSFCALFNISEVDAILVNDSMIIEKTIEAEELSGADVLMSYCELNGVFPNINRQGNLEYITLPNDDDMKELYPSNELYPNDDVLPQNSNSKHVYRSEYRSCTYDEFVTQKITKLQIRQEENDVGAISGTGNNCYIIEDNFLVYGKDSNELNTVADNLFNLISSYTNYRPYSVVTVGDPCIKVGECVRISTRYEIVVSFILSRTLHGINALIDTYSAQGVETYNEIVNDVRTSILQLKGKTNVLTRTVDETKSTLTDLTNNLQSQITQNANNITLKVSKGDVSSEISQESDKITISGDRFVLNSTNCSISEDGKITATDCDLSGNITASNGNIGGFTIGTNSIYSGKTSLMDTEHSGIYIGTNGIELGNKWNDSSDNVISIDRDNGILSLYSNFGKRNLPIIYSGTNDWRNPIMYCYSGNQYRSSDMIRRYSLFVYPCKIQMYGDMTNDNVVYDYGGVYVTYNGSEVAQLSRTNLIAPNATINGNASISGSLSVTSTITTTGAVCAKGDFYYYDGRTNYKKIGCDSSTVQLCGNSVIGESSNNKIGFFGNSGSTKKSVNTMSTSSPTISTCVSKINELINALRNYNLI